MKSVLEGLKHKESRTIIKKHLKNIFGIVLGGSFALVISRILQGVENPYKITEEAIGVLIVIILLYIVDMLREIGRIKKPTHKN